MKNLEIIRRAQSARPRGMSLANLLRGAKGGACPPLLNRYKKAYFLLEALIAMAILATILGSILTSLISGSRYLGSAKNHIRSIVVAEQIFEDIRYHWSNDQIATNPPGWGWRAPLTAASQPPLRDLDFSASYSITLLTLSPATWVYVVEVSVIPVNQVYPPEGARIVSFIADR